MKMICDCLLSLWVSISHTVCIAIRANTWNGIQVDFNLISSSLYCVNAKCIQFRTRNLFYNSLGVCVCIIRLRVDIFNQTIWKFHQIFSDAIIAGCSSAERYRLRFRKTFLRRTEDSSKNHLQASLVGYPVDSNGKSSSLLGSVKWNYGINYKYNRFSPERS